MEAARRGVEALRQAQQARGGGIEAGLDLQVDDDEAFIQLGRRWLIEAPRVLAPRLWARLQGSLPLSDLPLDDATLGAVWGPPNGAWAHVTIVPRPWEGGVQVHTFSPQRWRWLLAQLRGRPKRASVEVTPLDPAGIQHLDEDGVPSGWGLRVGVEVLEEDPRWVRLRAGGSLPDGEADVAREPVAERWVSFLRGIAADVDPSFGFVSDRIEVPPQTMLDDALNRSHVDSVMAGRAVLRGYGWVTVCPRELAERLGGAEGLAATGAFARVEPLPAGGVLLRATEAFDDYDHAAVERTFRVFAPVLPHGRPSAPAWGPDWHLVYEDAADHS
jgi:hypothetical protein